MTASFTLVVHAAAADPGGGGGGGGGGGARAPPFIYKFITFRAAFYNNSCTLALPIDTRTHELYYCTISRAPQYAIIPLPTFRIRPETDSTTPPPPPPPPPPLKHPRCAASPLLAQASLIFASMMVTSRSRSNLWSVHSTQLPYPLNHIKKLQTYCDAGWHYGS